MGKTMRKIYSRMTLKLRLQLLTLSMVIPLCCISAGILWMIQSYSGSYQKIMNNLKIANEFNLNFKEEMEYSMYRVMIGLIDVEKFKDGDIVEGSTAYATVVRNPYTLIEHANEAFAHQLQRIPDSYSDSKVKGILYCLKSLENAVTRMIDNASISGSYEENNTIWENDIQGLCSMIQDYITQYIYFENLRMEALQNELEEHTLQAMILGGVTLAAVLALGTFYTAVLTRSVTRPIHNLQETAERLGRGELEAKADFCSLEEIDVLARTFNTMSGQIEALLDKTRQEQENLRLLELKLRQEQINPHFLYNTLDSIIWMAEGRNHQQVVEMTTNLSDFFRTVLSEGKDFITVEEELRHIESYLKIQKIRYEDVLDYQISSEPELAHRVVLKMILQPVVENALYHGIKNKRGGGTIYIRARRDGKRLVLEVEDNGIGMDEDRLEQLRAQLMQDEPRLSPGERGGFGLRNVLQRIHMYYGPESGLSIRSQKQLGTTVTIFLESR